MNSGCAKHTETVMGGQVTIPLVLVLFVFRKSVSAFIFADQSCAAQYQCPSRVSEFCADRARRGGGDDEDGEGVECGGGEGRRMGGQRR